jgi:hypothetical protein
VGDYVDHALIIEIVGQVIINSSFQFSKLCIRNCRECVLEVVHNTNVVFGVGMAKDETCFE